MSDPTPNRLPFKFDELDRAVPMPRRVWIIVACIAGAAILTGALIALVDALI